MKKIKKAVFILPHFGKLPNYFPLYLTSCKYCTDFDWLIFTDDHTSYMYPENVKVIYMSFQDIKDLIQSKFGFEISLENPYKLCDFRPAFGFVFHDYIVDYKFWGHADPDCIWGNLNIYLSDNLLYSYNKLFLLGHLTLYKNTDVNNKMFMRNLCDHERYKEVMGSPSSMYFDEAKYNGSINDIYIAYNEPIYEDKNRADICPIIHAMRTVLYESPKSEVLIEPFRFQYFEWNRGVLNKVSFSLKRGRVIEECSYLHLHGGRKMKYTNFHADRFLISRNSFWKTGKYSRFFIVSIILLDSLFAFAIDNWFLIKRYCK